MYIYIYIYIKYSYLYFFIKNMLNTIYVYIKNYVYNDLQLNRSSFSPTFVTYRESEVPSHRT